MEYMTQGPSSESPRFYFHNKSNPIGCTQWHKDTENYSYPNIAMGKKLI
jgi:hypothetical protein